jgi:hypothetical protein
MLLNNMDEALDIKPTVTIEGKQLELLKIESASTGQKYQLCAMATIASISQDKGDNGIPSSRITFELSAIELEAPEQDLAAAMYPNSPAPTK